MVSVFGKSFNVVQMHKLKWQCAPVALPAALCLPDPPRLIRSPPVRPRQTGVELTSATLVDWGTALIL